MSCEPSSKSQKSEQSTFAAPLPKELQQLVADYLNTDITTPGAKNPHATLVAIRSNCFFNEQLLTLKTLLKAIVQTNYAEVKALLRELKENHPEFLKQMLQQKASVTDHTGYEYKNVTLLQLALHLGDVDLVFKVNGKQTKVRDGIAELIADVMKEEKVFGVVEGLKIIEAQYKGVFPNGVEEKEVEPPAGAVSALNAIIEAIEGASLKNTANHCELALEEFRKYFKENPMCARDAEALLLHAYTLYNQKFNALGGNNWNDKRIDVITVNVIGYLQRLLPANDLQVFARGIYDVVLKATLVPRDFKFYNDKDVFIFPFIFPLDKSKLGFESRAAGALRGAEEAWEGRRRVVAWKNLCRAKTSALQVLCSVQTINKPTLAA